VVGPTASGKTGLSVYLAGQLGGEVVSADAFQIYKGMDIGTAKVTPDEMKGVPHHLIDILPPSAPYSLGRYLEDATAVLEDIYRRQKLPVICGGTGLYVSHLIDGTALGDIPAMPELREALYAEAAREGNAALHRRLAEVDPELAKTLHPNNLGRIVRALEVHAATGLPQSLHQARSRRDSPYRLCILGLYAEDRALLYRRIDRRVELMAEMGLVEEVARLRAAGLGAQASQAIGYKELFPYLDGEKSLDSCLEDLKRATRRYAKRQLTWWRRDSRVRWLAIDRLTPEQLRRQALVLASDHDSYI
jgi:tRNA dimethylallyltransferase